jgi:hypothetical protein
MTEKELNQFGLLEEFSITELEQRLEFEAWCDLICTSNDRCNEPNSACPPINGGCGGGGGGGGEPLNTDCPIEIQP